MTTMTMHMHKAAPVEQAPYRDWNVPQSPNLAVPPLETLSTYLSLYTLALHLNERLTK